MTPEDHDHTIAGAFDDDHKDEPVGVSPSCVRNSAPAAIALWLLIAILAITLYRMLR